MKKIICFLCVFSLILSLGTSALAAKGNIDFSPVTVGSFSNRSALDWYDDEYCVDLCVYLLHDSGFLDEFLENGVNSRTYITQESALISVGIDLGDRTIGYFCVPALGTANYNIFHEGQMSDYLFEMLMGMMAEQLGTEGRIKKIPEQLWDFHQADALESIGIIQAQNEINSPAFAFSDFLQVKCQSDVEMLLGQPESISEKFGTYYYCASLMGYEFSLDIKYDNYMMIEEVTLNSEDDRIEDFDEALDSILQGIVSEHGEPDRFDSPVGTTTFTWMIGDFEIELYDWGDLGLGARLSIYRREK